MTEAEWLVCEDPVLLLCGLKGRIGSRKYRLFEVASSRLLAEAAREPLLIKHIEYVERLAEGQPVDQGLLDASCEAVWEYHQRIAGKRYLRLPGNETPDDPQFRDLLVRVVAASRVSALLGSMDWWFWVADLHRAEPPETFDHHTDKLTLDTYRETLPLLRCVVGNPFRPATFDPAWRTSTVTTLATQMYESRDFSPMPILADALQDAGCDSEDILNHCRDPKQVHVRGCWVVDLVLGKE